MKYEVKVVIGANYGDEGKGLVSYCLAKEAVNRGKKVLTVLHNGGAQRGHTAGGKVHHTTGAGVDLGSDTYYGPRFMLDPIALWLAETKVYVDPMCRVVLPCDVAVGRDAERVRGDMRHGSCGMGIFAASKRNATPRYRLLAREVFNDPMEFVKARIREISDIYGWPGDTVYNNKNLIEAIKWMRNHCICKDLNAIKSMYKTVIFEGGQGLMLDQGNRGGFPHLTPSSTGARNTLRMIKELGGLPDIYYVSRTYMTRHGNGPLFMACAKEDINPDIVDETNVPNEWQGALRFGYLTPAAQERRIRKDLAMFDGFERKRINMVYTQTNYTDGKLAVGPGEWLDIEKPSFANRLWLSDRKDDMKIKED